MKNLGVFVTTVIVVFFLGLSAPLLLEKLGVLQPVVVKTASSRMALPTNTPAPTKRPLPTSNPVPTSLPIMTLQSAPGQNIVQMFDSISSNNSTVTRFATGLQCLHLSGPHTITEGGVTMSFYKLDCLGKRGYVNTQWVR